MNIIDKYIFNHILYEKIDKNHNFIINALE